MREGNPAGRNRIVVVVTVEATTLGEAWLETSRRILHDGADATYDELAIRELRLLSIAVAEPDAGDPLIASLADPDWLGWMHANFTQLDAVEALGGARSYASRLRDYAGRDQVAWVVERLRADPQTRSATITTFEPRTDTSYIPCISMLDFWRPVGDALELVVYAHSLDFGKKAYGNLVELARLQAEVAERSGAPVGTLTIHVKSAHVYEPELALMARLVEARALDPASARS
jgi:thymidylate synthase